MKSILAFTLAEVLIVLGIIGIVAEMTIPSVYTNFEKQVTATTLKKAYTDLNLALVSAKVDNGSPDAWTYDFNTQSVAATKNFVENYIYPYIKTIRKCENGDTTCWTDSVSLDGTPVDAFCKNNATTISAITPAGYSVLFSTSPNLVANLYTIDAVIDVNGPNKKPNRFGHDVFVYRFRYSSNTRPMFAAVAALGYAGINRNAMLSNTTYGCGKGASSGAGAGLYCAGLILADGWQISDDYNWK